jgi:thiol-disulfide isomerase/thioredoxin
MWRWVPVCWCGVGVGLTGCGEPTVANPAAGTTSAVVISQSEVVATPSLTGSASTVAEKPVVQVAGNDPAPAGVDAPSIRNEAIQAANATEPDAPKWQTEVTLAHHTWAETQALVAQHVGKVVVVDVWSTACEPCLREFPKLVELQQQHPQEIVCIGLNCDYAGIRKKPPEYYTERVMKVLTAKDAKIINVLCTEPADELFVSLKIDSIPAVFVYDTAGVLQGTFDNRTNDSAEFTYVDDVLPKVQALLTKTP